MNDAREKLKSLLRELFQFDCADLDFGIYRIMNYKREAIEKFINEGLFNAITKDLDTGILARQADVAKELEETSELIIKTLGYTAINGDGDLAEQFRTTVIGERYLDLREQARYARSRSAIESEIFNHFYSFFSRYYDNGDFLSKRRYGRREKYAVPYNGEEVYLHWANSDQYYIKTSEYFTDYCYKAPSGIAVHFKVRAADVEKDNVKGEKRFFVPLVKEGSYNPETREVVLPFNYRPLSDQEKVKYGTRNQQEAITTECVDACKSHFKKEGDALSALFADHHKRSDGSMVSFLEHNLCQYSKRNTSDFFIHKDLKGFLTRELDFFLKNEVLNLVEMEAAGEGRADGWFQIMRVIRSVGGCVIDFLAQIENFQKMLFEKKKFIIDTQYLITVGNIPEEFYPEIADSEVQWKEWKELYHIDEDQTDLFTNGKSKGERRISFVKEHPSLVLDTKLFSNIFTDKILSTFVDLEFVTDGLLFWGENYQAINLLLEKYSQRLSCIHIDPPYNTQTSGFLYKNDYQHSSWLSMMENRIKNSSPLLTADGAYLCHIDENEYELLHLLFGHIDLPDGGTIIWDKKNPMLGRRGVATQHEYILWRTRVDNPIYLRPVNVRRILEKAASIIKQYGGVNADVRREYSSWISSCEGLSGGERAYRLIDDDGRVFQSVAMGAPETRTDPKFHIPLIHPITKKPCPVPSNGWSRTPENLKELISNGEIIFGGDESVQPRKKVFLNDDSKRQISSVISDASRGKTDVEKMGLEFPYCHPVSLYEELLGAATQKEGDYVLDFFAGSGSNGHAVINLNRSDGGNRRFILVEMAEYFNSVLLPRIKKVIFSPEWKEGKPLRAATKDEFIHSPRIINYSSIESYDDALNNIMFSEASQSLFSYDDYLIKYMLEWETKESPTLLNVEKLSRPFDYKLNITDGLETGEKVVDLPETFNYLLGLYVKTRRVYHDDDRRYLAYRGTVDHREIAVIWRTTDKWEQKDFERDRDFVAKEKLTEGADEVFVNGDSYIPEAKALEPLFKRRMFGGV